MGLLKRITHFYLEGEDYAQCSLAFLYILTLLSLRNIIRKALGINRPRTREYLNLGLILKFAISTNGHIYTRFSEKSKKAMFFLKGGLYGYSFYKIMRKHQAVKY